MNTLPDEVKVVRDIQYWLHKYNAADHGYFIEQIMTHYLDAIDALASTKQSNEDKEIECQARLLNCECIYPKCECQPASASNESLQQAAKEENALSILKELVELKEIKDYCYEQEASGENIRKMEDYLKRKPLAWEKAKQLLAGASFNKDAVEFAEWCDNNYFGIGDGLWAINIGEPEEQRFTTQELYNLFLVNKNEIQQAHDKAQYE